MSFHGLIQHSFALRLAKEHRPFPGPDVESRIRERFAFPAGGGPAFALRSVREDGIHGIPSEGREEVAAHSPLARSGLTGVAALPTAFSGADASPGDPDLPPVFEWAGRGWGEIDRRQAAPTFIFADGTAGGDGVEFNDYLVGRPEPEPEAEEISLTLLRILAHKRSRLLGLALANRIVSVMLPHAILTPFGASAERPWFVQPHVSLIRDGRVKTEFRDTYSLTLLLVPIEAGGYRERPMDGEEIDRVVNAGWGLAAVPTVEGPPRFEVSGPLFEYLRRLAAPYDPASLLGWADAEAAPSLTLRQAAEILAFGLGLRLAQGPAGGATERTEREIGDDVVTALGSARVSSVLVVDPELTRADIRAGGEAPLQRHRDLMAKISRETRPPLDPAEYRNYRLDRPFVDDETYVVGVLPAKRCLVISCAADAQHGWYQSGLMQAGSLSHMTIGAATAIGTLRAIDRDLEGLEDGDPTRIADIDGAIATDLCEIYDLDITCEEYRNMYRLLRQRLGINRDYEALRDRMATLYQSSSTRHEVRSQHLLAALTVAIVLLSVLILVATIVK
jgi:hypothetical protein